MLIACYQTLPAPAHANNRLIYTLRQYPATEDFVYLRCASGRAPGDWNPYALEVVPFATLRANPEAAADYYTLSVRGVTHYLDGANAEFTSEPRQCLPLASEASGPMTGWVVGCSKGWLLLCVHVQAGRFGMPILPPHGCCMPPITLLIEWQFSVDPLLVLISP